MAAYDRDLWPFTLSAPQDLDNGARIRSGEGVAAAPKMGYRGAGFDIERLKMAAERPERFDAIVLGAGAAGMFCAVRAGRGGARVLVVDHAKAPGEKIRISGGGRCNFTNIHAGPTNFISANRHFAKSALSRFTAADFVALIEKHRIPYHEKTLGQLFCDRSAMDVIEMLRAEMSKGGAELRLRTAVSAVEKTPEGYRAQLETEGRRWAVEAPALVVATGGKSIPKMGATGLAYRLAEQFGLGLIETRAGLVPLTFGDDALEGLRTLAGVAAPCRASAARGPDFEEALLFTHRGLSGPAILQISSYWREGETIALSLAPGVDFLSALQAARGESGKRGVVAALAEHLPKRLAQSRAAAVGLDRPLGGVSDKALSQLVDTLTNWRLTPTGSEGYRTAEVTLGGVDTAHLDSRSMSAKHLSGLYFIGEAVDVTGWLGGYNFQWAWSSAWAAGGAIAEGRGG